MKPDAARDWGGVWRRCARRWEGFARRLGKRTSWRVWNPGRYGERWHRRFREVYPVGPNPILILGLNPGPYGMGQTGIPFTDVRRLETELPDLAGRLRAEGEPVRVPGLAPPDLRPRLSRTFESSSVRIYRFLRLAAGNAGAGWRRVVAANPCPLLFMEGSANRTPADLGRVLRAGGVEPSAARKMLEECDRLRRKCVQEAVRALEPRGVVLLGRNVQGALGGDAAFDPVPGGTLCWEHPARAVPDAWAAGLLREIRRRGWWRG